MTESRPQDPTSPDQGLARQLELEKVISDISAWFTAPLGPNLDEVCARLGEVVRAKRAYIFKIRPGGALIDNTHEWCAPGVVPQITDLQNLQVEIFPWFRERLGQGENIVIPDVDRIPPEGAMEQRLIQTGDVLSLAVAPIFSSGELAGFIGFDETDVRRDWSAGEVRMLRIVGEMIGNEMARRQAEKDRERLLTRLFQADRMNTVGQLAAGIAHEIQNPLSFVLPNLYLLKKHLAVIANWGHMLSSGAPRDLIDAYSREHQVEGLVESLDQILGDCLDGVTRIHDATRELRAFSAIDDRQAEAVDLRSILESSLVIAANEIRYRAQLRKSLGQVPEVVVNPGKMSQAFLNLLLFSARAIEEGQVDAHWIRVTSGQLGQRLFVEIAHNGRPIPPEALTRVFDPFAHDPGGAEGLGLGLGLSISNALVLQHGGQIDVRSDATEGTVFTVWLPRQTGLTPARPDQEGEGAAIRGRLLVVDDEAPILRLLDHFLGAQHELVLCDRGQDALAHVEAGEDFDLVISDLMMQGLSGMELFQRVERSRPDLADRFLFLTGGAFTPQAEEFVKRHADRIVEKPVESEKLKSMVRQRIAAARRREGTQNS